MYALLCPFLRCPPYLRCRVPLTRLHPSGPQPGALYLMLGAIYRLALGFMGPFANGLIFFFNLAFSLAGFIQIIMGLGGKVADTDQLYSCLSGMYAIVMVVALALSLFLVFQQVISFYLVYAALGLYAMYFISGILHFEFFSILSAAGQYYVMMCARTHAQARTLSRCARAPTPRAAAQRSRCCCPSTPSATCTISRGARRRGT